MSSSEPSKWTTALGASADVNVVPATTPAGTGLASMSSLFPAITQVPIDAGGIAPERADFNALFKMLGDQSYFLQQGGVYSYSASYPYSVGDLVRYNGNLYRCIQAHAAGAANPTNTTYWSKLATLQDIPPATTVNDGQLTINVNGSAVATFTANQAGNSTADITIPAAPTVGDGTITVNVAGSSAGSFTTNQGGNSTINIPAASASAFGVVKIGSGITVTNGVISMGGSKQIFFADANSTQDAAIRAAGFWRCGSAYAFWGTYDNGPAGGAWYICYAPNGHTITEVDLRWSYAQVITPSVNGSQYSRGELQTVEAWIAPRPPATSNPQKGVNVPRVGMTQANEVPFPANPYVPN